MKSQNNRPIAKARRICALVTLMSLSLADTERAGPGIVSAVKLDQFEAAEYVDEEYL